MPVLTPSHMDRRPTGPPSARLAQQSQQVRPGQHTHRELLQAVQAVAHDGHVLPAVHPSTHSHRQLGLAMAHLHNSQRAHLDTSWLLQPCNVLLVGKRPSLPGLLEGPSQEVGN